MFSHLAPTLATQVCLSPMHLDLLLCPGPQLRASRLTDTPCQLPHFAQAPDHPVPEQAPPPHIPPPPPSCLLWVLGLCSITKYLHLIERGEGGISLAQRMVSLSCSAPNRHDIYLSATSLHMGSVQRYSPCQLGPGWHHGCKLLVHQCL